MKEYVTECVRYVRSMQFITGEKESRKKVCTLSQRESVWYSVWDL